MVHVLLAQMSPAELIYFWLTYFRCLFFNHVESVLSLFGVLILLQQSNVGKTETQLVVNNPNLIPFLRDIGFVCPRQITIILK